MRSIPILLYLAGLCLFTTGVQAQQRRSEASSHDLLPGVIDRNVAERRLAERFQIASENSPLGLLEAMLKNPERYGIDLKEVAKMAKEIGAQPGDLGINL